MGGKSQGFPNSPSDSASCPYSAHLLCVAFTMIHLLLSLIIFLGGGLLLNSKICNLMMNTQLPVFKVKLLQLTNWSISFSVALLTCLGQNKRTKTRAASRQGGCGGRLQISRVAKTACIIKLPCNNQSGKAVQLCLLLTNCVSRCGTIYPLWETARSWTGIKEAARKAQQQQLGILWNRFVICSSWAG